MPQAILQEKAAQGRDDFIAIDALAACLLDDEEEGEEGRGARLQRQARDAEVRARVLGVVMQRLCHAQRLP